LRAELAEEVVRKSAKGYHYGVFVMDITGGERGKKNRGVNLLVVVAEPGVSNRKAQAYVDMLAKDASIVGRQTTQHTKPQSKGCLFWLLVILAFFLWVGFKFAG